ncbi:MAG: FG-GAP repeat protein, partial [Solirubrobacteraceae bacterium]
GNTALIGGPGDNNSVVAVWVFTRSGATWTQQGEKLTGGGEISSDQVRGHLGYSVALSADGETALIGGPGDNGGVGAAWVFTRSAATWAQQGEKLIGGGEGGKGAFGTGLALSANGNTALIGAPANNGGYGATWAFTRSGTTWTQQGSQFTGVAKSGASAFGISVALSPDGNTALIGGPDDNSGVGAAWVFTRSEATWAQQGGKLTGSGGTGESAFGSSVALSSDGSTALVGGPGDNTHMGAAWVFANLPPSGTPQGASPTATTPLTAATSTSTSTAPTPPTVADVTQSNRRWREGGALASFARRRRLPPLGTMFSFALNEQANVSFAFTQQQPGRTVNGRCVAQTKKSRHAPPCQHTVTQGTISFLAHSGTNKVFFQGRNSYAKRLRPGGYTLVITAINADGHSSDSPLSFTIVK